MSSPTSTRSPASTSWALCALYSIIGLVGALWPLDDMLRGQRGRPWPFEDLSAADGGAVLVALVALCLINAVLLDSLMAGKVSDPRTVPGWLRRLRFVSAGIPLIGMYTTVVWLWWLNNLSRRALREAPKEGGPTSNPLVLADDTFSKARSWLSQRYGVLFSSRAQWLGIAPLFFTGLLAVNLLGLQAVTLWWASFGPDLFGLPAGYLLTVPLHAMAFACAASYLLVRRRLLILKPIRRILVWPLALLWCLPAPYCILGGLVVLVVESAPRRRLLARAAYRSRQEWTRSGLEVYSFLRRSVRRWPDGLSPAQPAYVRDHLVRLYRVKIALLPIETAAVAAGLIWWSGKNQLLGFLVWLGAYVLLVVAGLLAAASAMAVATIKLRGHRSDVSPPLAYAAAGQALFATGLYLGMLLGSANHFAFGTSLYNAATIGCLVAGVPGVSRRRHMDTEHLTWIGVFLTLLLLGFWISLGGPLAATAAGLLALGTILGTVGSGVVLGPWLLRPLTWVHLDDPGRRKRSRRRLGILSTSLLLPFGGLLIPLWLYARRRLDTKPPPNLTSAAGEGPNSTTGDWFLSHPGKAASHAQSTRRDYSFLHLASHLANTGDDRRLWILLEEKSFLAEQARYCRGFRRGSSDLESAVLPATIRLRDWNRFLRYSLVAVNLRGLADQLSDEGLLEILARRGHLDLALEAAGRIAETSRRLRARIVVGVCLERDDPRFAVLMDRLREDLEELAPPPNKDTMDHLHGLLIGLARAFGPELGPALNRHVARRWPASHSEGAQEELRIAEAWGCLQRAGDEPGPELWHALSLVRSPEILAAHLPKIIASSKPCEDPLAILEHIRTLPAAQGDLLWLCRAALLGVLSEHQQDTAHTLWGTWRAAETVPWSANLVVCGARFFQRLASEQLRRIAEDVDDDQAQAALWLAVLFGMRESESHAERPEGRNKEQIEDLAAIARAAIDRLPPEEQPVWILPWVDAVHTFPVEGLETELLRLATLLKRAGYAAPPDDLVRFFDLVAVLRPRDLRPWMANAVIASPSGPDLLLALAETSGNEDVLTTLLERSERYFLGFSLSTEQTVELWNIVLERVVSRLCVVKQQGGAGRGGLAYLEQARSLVRDEDALRMTVASSLATAGATDLAAEVCEGIENERARRAAQLRLLSGTDSSAEPSLAPDALYEALANVDEMNDELQALAALRSPEPGVDSIFGRHCEPMLDKDHQVPALIRLMRNRSDARAGASGVERREWRVAWHVLEEALAAGQADKTLVALTPELPALSRPLGIHRVVEEIHGSFQQLLALSAVPWDERRRALEALLAQVGTVLFESPSQHRSTSRQNRWASALLRALATDVLAMKADDHEAEDLLPLLVTVAERHPRVARRLGQSPRKHRHWLPRPSADGLDPDATIRDQVLALCRADDGQRLAFAASLRDRPEYQVAFPSTKKTVPALAYLLSTHHAEAVPDLIETMPPGPERDDLGLQLTWHRWVPLAVAGRILTLIRDPLLNREARLWHDLETADGQVGARWIRDLATLATRRGLEPDDLRYEPWFRALRASDQEHSLPALAEAVTQALGEGGGFPSPADHEGLDARSGGTGRSPADGLHECDP